jgi:hypothetical protein
MAAQGGGYPYSQGGYYPPPASRLPTLEEWLEDYRGRVEKRRKHIRILSVVLIVMGILFVVTGLALGGLFISSPLWDPHMKESDKVLLPVVGVLFLLFCMVFGIWPTISAWAIRKGREWGRWSAVLFCALTSPMACGSLCCLPVTIWGIWALVGPEADGVFGHEPKPPPHLVPAHPSRRGRHSTPVEGRKTGSEPVAPAAGDQEPAPEKPAGEPQAGALPLYGETAKPSGRTPIPQIYPRPRVSSKTPPEGVYRYEPKPPSGAGDSLTDVDKERPQSYSSIPTARDIKKPELPPEPDKENKGG